VEIPSVPWAGLILSCLDRMYYRGTFLAVWCHLLL
jgi:hypothetical protein